MAVSVAGGPQLQEDGSQCPYYGWSASEVEGAAGPSRRPPETQHTGCVWVALRLCVLPFPMSWLPLLASCLPFPPSVVPVSHGLTQRAGLVSLLVRDFVTQAQSNSILPPGRNAYVGVSAGGQ